MRYAVDKWTNKEIEASEATYGASYCCPVCWAPVTLRSGVYRDAYFAHKAGMGTDDCDLYHLGSQSASAHALQNEHNSPWEFRLNIQTSNDEFPRAWGLELELPQREGISGEIEIDVGGRIRKVVVSPKLGNSIRITAEPQVAPYMMKSANIIGRVSQPVLARFVGALRENGATVFGEACVARKSTTPRARYLEYGATYLFVWRAQLSPNIPDELVVEPLHKNGEWDGAIIEIPTLLSHQCKHWLENFTGLALNPLKPQLIPLWPPVARKVSTELIEAPSHTALMFCLRGTGGIEFKNSTAFIRSGENIAAIEAPGEGIKFFKLKNDGEPYLEFALRDRAELRAEIEYVPIRSAFSQPHMAVELHGKNTETGKQCSIQAHDEKAIDWLAQVRARAIEITTVVMPLYARGTLYRGRSGIWSPISDIIPAASDNVTAGRSYSTALAKSISEAVAQRKVDIKINFGGFGSLILLADAPEAASEPRSPLPKEIKQRLRAYMAQLPLPYTQRAAVLRLTDEQLVARFRASMPTKTTTQYYRELIKQLNKSMH